MGEIDRRGYELFTSDSLSHNLNIVGVRNPDAHFNSYGCELWVFWQNGTDHRGEPIWIYLSFQITTFPGSYYLIDKLLNRRGGAILAEGQYRGVYMIDNHQGKYPALCQRNGKVRVFRDGNRDRKYDLNPATIHDGHFGINLHAPTRPRDGFWNYVAEFVKNASAGCQVFKSVADFLHFMKICRKAESIWGNSFTYTLLSLPKK